MTSAIGRTPSSSDSGARRIGDVAVESGLITPTQRDQALASQQKEGGRLGRHLILMGAVSRRELYSCVAEQLGFPMVDLVQDPPDRGLMTAIDPAIHTEREWIPYRWAEGTHLIVATAEPPTRAMIAAALQDFGATEVDFVITTDWDIAQAVSIACREALLFKVAEELAVTRPDESAASGVTWWQWGLFALAAGVAIAVLAWNPRVGVISIMLVANVVFSVSILFKTVAAIRWPFRQAAIEAWNVKVAEERVRRGRPPFFWRERAPDDELPLYTILVPAYNEEGVITKVLEHLEELDYPKSKLEVLVLLEEDDVATLSAARASCPPEYVRIVVVPEGSPKTKPRACNYGLEIARGEFLVIFDAEDRPEPNQLRESVKAFRKAEFEHTYVGDEKPPVICVQAALNYFNADYNVLTRMFAIEYSFWFDAMLPGLDDSGVPLPLGGTSNHFSVTGLRRLGGWDPYNVTEDADLGLRASVMGYRVSTIRSTTWEEACSQVRPWIRQRTRWIKGYLVTAAVNTRHPLRFFRHTGILGTIGMMGLILGTPLAFLAYPIALLFTLITYLGVQFIGLDLPEWLLLVGGLTMVFGNLMMIAASGVTAATRYGWRIAIFSVFAPVYWLLHAFAAWRALFQLMFNPFKWEKTPHGLSGDYETVAHKA